MMIWYVQKPVYFAEIPSYIFQPECTFQQLPCPDPGATSMSARLISDVLDVLPCQLPWENLENSVPRWRVRGLPLTCLLRTEYDEESQDRGQ